MEDISGGRLGRLDATSVGRHARPLLSKKKKKEEKKREKKKKENYAINSATAGPF